MTEWFVRNTQSAAPRICATCESVANIFCFIFIARLKDGFARNSKCVLVLLGVLPVADPQAAAKPLVA